MREKTLMEELISNDFYSKIDDIIKTITNEIVYQTFKKDICKYNLSEIDYALRKIKEKNNMDFELMYKLSCLKIMLETYYSIVGKIEYTDLILDEVSKHTNLAKTICNIRENGSISLKFNKENKGTILELISYYKLEFLSCTKYGKTFSFGLCRKSLDYVIYLKRTNQWSLTDMYDGICGVNKKEGMGNFIETK